MPQLFKIRGYLVYFWSNENEPLEPIHVHVSLGQPSHKSAKIWISQRGKCRLSSNSLDIEPRKLNNIMKIIEARSDEIIRKWSDFFGEIRFYC